MKRFCLFFCCGCCVFWGSLSIVFATPIHDKGGGGFTFDATGSDSGNGHFFEEPGSDCFACFSGQSGIDKYSLGSVVSAFKIEKNARKSKNQNQHDSMEDGQRVSNPVPATLFLLGTGLVGLAAFRRKRTVRL